MKDQRQVQEIIEKASVSTKVSAILAKAFSDHVTVRYTIDQEHLDEAVKLCQTFYDNQGGTPINKDSVGMVLFLLGGYALALEANITNEQLRNIQKEEILLKKDVKKPVLKAITLQGSVYTIIKSNLNKLYPTLYSNGQAIDDESFVAHMGFIFLKRVQAGQIHMPPSLDSDLTLILNGYLVPKMSQRDENKIKLD